MFRANYPVDNPPDILENIPMPCLLGNLGSFSGRNIKSSSKQRGALFVVVGILYKPCPGADPEFQVGGHFKILFGVFRVKNHDFTQKNHIFSNFRGGAPGAPTPHWSRPCFKSSKHNT